MEINDTFINKNDWTLDVKLKSKLMDHSSLAVRSNKQTKKLRFFFLKYITVSRRHRASTVPS